MLRTEEGQGNPGSPAPPPPPLPQLHKSLDFIGTMLVTSRLQGCRQGSDKIWLTVFKPLPAVWIRDWGGREWNS